MVELKATQHVPMTVTITESALVNAVCTKILESHGLCHANYISGGVIYTNSGDSRVDDYFLRKASDAEVESFETIRRLRKYQWK